MNRRAQGSAAEEVAMRYLEQKGYKTLARNYTIRGGEIDLIMRAPQGTLVFVEVKARGNARYGSGLDAVTPRKQASAGHLPPLKKKRADLEYGKGQNPGHGDLEEDGAKRPVPASGFFMDGGDCGGAGHVQETEEHQAVRVQGAEAHTGQEGRKLGHTLGAVDAGDTEKHRTA